MREILNKLMVDTIFLQVDIYTGGYVVVDDTGHPQFDNSLDWPWVVSLQPLVLHVVQWMCPR